MLRDDGSEIKIFTLVGIALSLLASACGSIAQVGSTSVKDIQDLAWQGDCYLWVGGSDGVARWNVCTGSVTTFSFRCKDLLVTNGDTVWISDGGTVSVYQGQSWRTFNRKDGLIEGYDGARLLRASDGSIWLGNSGLSRYDPIAKSWQVIVSPLPNVPPTHPPGSINEVYIGAITALLQAKDNTVWAASTSGVIRVSGASQRTWTVSDGLADNVVRALLETHDGIIWAGTNQGISRWDGSRWQTLPYASTPDTNGSHITDILFEKSDGTVWANTWEGIARWDGSTWQAWPIAKNSPRYNGVRAMLETSNGDLWIGTWGDGAYRWDGSKWHIYTTAEGLSANRIQVLVKGPENTLWASTYGGGVDRYDSTTNRWQSFPAPFGNQKK